jgi:glycosyltransferase involved in cell wall biosynthesis
MTMRLGYLYSRYPVLSQTFCDTEMLELERRGWHLVIASMYPPKTPVRHEYLGRFRAQVQYAPEKPALEKLVKKAKRQGRWPQKLIAEHERKYGPDYKAALRARNALFFVDLFEREQVRHFHVHFANRAAHTALFVKAISDIPFSMTAHGQDFMTDLGNEALLCEICAAAEFVGAETDYSRDLLSGQCPNSVSKIMRIYNGMELEKFNRLPSVPRAEGPVRLLSVGRLVEFKGFDVLIDACAELRRCGVDFVCEIIGDGDLRDELRERAASYGLSEAVRFSGEQSQDFVLQALDACDVFILAALVDSRGASDVFPTVIAEAMAARKPVVSTTVAGIPELVAHCETGILVPPRDSYALADALGELIRDPALRDRFGRAGRERIEQHFTIEQTIEPLLQQLAKANTAAAGR